MAEKNTTELETELTKSDDVKKFLSANAENFREFTLAEYLKKLFAEKNLVKAQVIRDSQLDEGYVKKLFQGDIKIPAREKILALAVAMKLSPKETDYLLYYSGNEKLYVRNDWDAVIFFALENQQSVAETNSLLDELHMMPFLGSID